MALPTIEQMKRRFIFNFRGPVFFEEDAVRELCRLACEGYETPRKKETYGFLFGSLGSGRRVLVRRACYYRGGVKTRTGVVFKDWPTIRRISSRRLELSGAMRLRFLGSFHSHVEIAGEVFRGLSDEDRESFRNDPMATLEVVVFIWPRRNHSSPSSVYDIAGFAPSTGYNYRIRTYAKRKNGIRQVPARIKPSGVILEY